MICGASIVTYEHIDPPFKDAKDHDPAAMALLCEGCHGKVTRKFWSKDKVKEARRYPFCKREGYSWGEFDFANLPIIQFGGMRLVGCPIPVSVAGVPLIEVRPSPQPNAPFLLSALFCDSFGRPVLRITNNVWKAHADSWDLRCEGGRIEIREASGKYALSVLCVPPTEIAIDRLHMRHGALELRGSANQLDVYRGGQLCGSYTDCGAENCSIGLML